MLLKNIVIIKEILLNYILVSWQYINSNFVIAWYLIEKVYVDYSIYFFNTVNFVIANILFPIKFPNGIKIIKANICNISPWVSGHMGSLKKAPGKNNSNKFGTSITVWMAKLPCTTLWMRWVLICRLRFKSFSTSKC